MQLFIENLTQKQLDEIEGLMRPNQLSKIGFLSAQERLQEIIELDLETLRQANITPTQIADRLEAILGKALEVEDLSLTGRIQLTEEEKEGFGNGKGKGKGILVENKYRVQATQYRGKQECPFMIESRNCPEKEEYGYMDCTITNIESSKSVSFPGLLIHLVKHHQFFEGSTSYRVEPAELIEVLELLPSMDYSTSKQKEMLWEMTNHWSSLVEFKELIDKEDYSEENGIMSSPDKIISPIQGIKIYIKNDDCLVVSDDEYQLENEITIGNATLEDMEIFKGVSHYELSEKENILID